MTEFIIGVVVGAAMAIAVPMIWSKTAKPEEERHPEEEQKRSSRPVYRFRSPSKGK
jgi:hypothetical protein